MNKLKKAYANMSRPVKASIYFTICNILQKGIALISAPVFTRLLTPEQYGLYTVYNSWYSMISIFATLNLSSGVFISGLTKFGDDRKHFTSSMQGLSTTVTCVFFLIYLLGMQYWNNLFELPTLLFIMMFFELFCVPAYGFWSNIQRYEYRYKKLVLITIGMSLANPICGIISVLCTDYKAEARIISSVLIQCCVGLVLYIYQMSKGKTFYSKKYWKYALCFNIPLIPHYLSMTVLQQADRLMIASFSGKTEAAVYSIAYTVSTLMTLITQAINNSFTPYTYQSIKEKKYSDIGKVAELLLILVGVGCVGVMAFGPEIITIMAPKEYYDAIWIIPSVACSVYFMFLYPLFGNVEFYYAKTKFTMFASCIGAVANVFLNWIFIPLFGYYAAGYTTLVCYILFALAHYMAYRNICTNELKKCYIYNQKHMLVISIVLLLVMIIMVGIYNYIVIRYSIIVLLMLICIIKRKYIIENIKKIRG